MQEQEFSPFAIDYINEINKDDTLQIEAEDRIRKLAEGHQDIVGASVQIKPNAEGRTTSYANEATVVIFISPHNLAATERAEQPMAALKGALHAVERQVREQRAKLRNY